MSTEELRTAARSAINRLAEHLDDDPAANRSHQYRDVLPIPGAGSLKADLDEVRAFFDSLDEACRAEPHYGDSLRPIGWRHADK